MFLKIISILKIILLQMVLFSSLQGADGWENPVRVSQKENINKYPDIFQDQNLTAIVWTSYVKGSPRIYFNYKDTGWHNPELVVKLNKNKIVLPSITMKDGTVYIFISNEKNGLEVLYRDLKTEKVFNRTVLMKEEEFCLLPNAYNFNNKLLVFYQRYINEEVFKIDYFTSLTRDTLSITPRTLIDISKKEYGSFFPIIKLNNDNIYSLWIERFGQQNKRNDVLFIKSSTGGFRLWSEKKMLSDPNTDAQFPDFFIDKNKLYLVYNLTEYKDYKYVSYLMTKIFDLNSLELLESKRIDLNISSFYQIKLRYFKNKYYIFWYSYIKKNPQIYYIQSDNFKEWSKFPITINKGGNDKLCKVNSAARLMILYEKKDKQSSQIYIREKDDFCNPPVVYSTTHKSDKWSYKNSAIFKWHDPYDTSGIKGYAYIMDTSPDTIPEIENLPGNFTGKSFEKLENGIQYFHIRAIDKAENFSSTVHYMVMVNSSIPEAPLIFSKTHEEFIPSDNNVPIFSWMKKDNRPVKGYAYLFTQDENLVPKQKINTTGTNVKFMNIKEGIWYFKVRTCDTLNRWSDYSTYTISVEKILTATKSSEAESRFSYIVKPKDVLSIIISKILRIKKKLEWRDYEKPVGKFNYLQNLDFLKPGDIVMFPIIIARPNDTIEKISRDMFGTEGQKNKIVIVGKESEDGIDAGDKVIIKDEYFLKTGKIKKKY